MHVQWGPAPCCFEWSKQIGTDWFDGLKISLPTVVFGAAALGHVFCQGSTTKRLGCRKPGGEVYELPYNTLSVPNHLMPKWRFRISLGALFSGGFPSLGWRHCSLWALSSRKASWASELSGTDFAATPCQWLACQCVCSSEGSKQFSTVDAFFHWNLSLITLRNTVGWRIWPRCAYR